ncbi:unnamed protein product [Adineta steineri]|uniref:Uncharacterized protein n=1 Tax=Adineta steineri TaxID=433720 RepID=A0A815EV75_9BILA|nr:unnamed protein product [Adineta steineri]
MSSMTNPVSIVKKLSIPDTHPDNSTKPLGSTIRHSSTSTTPSSIRLVTPTTGKSSPPTTALQLQFLDKSSTTTTNGGYTTSKTYILNPQQTSSSGTSSLVTLIPPGTTSPKIQTLISSTNDLSNNNNNNNDQKNSKQSSFISKNRLTFVQPLVTNASSTSSSSNSVTSKLVIQQNSTSNIWSQQPTTKILSAKMLSRPLHIISSNEHSNLSSPTSNENPIFTTKNLVQMSILPSSSTTDSINSVQLTNFYSTPSSVRISTTQQRPMDHNNNHSLTTPTIREIQTDEKLNDSTIIKNIHSNKNSIKNRTRLPLQPSTQQISSILPTSKKHKLPDDDEVSLSEPPTKKVHYEQFDSSSNGKKIRKTRHKSLSKTSIENTTPNSLPSSSSPLTSSIGVDTTGIIVSKKRSSAEIAAAAILSSNHMRKKRVQRKNSDETVSNNNNNNNNIKQETISVNDLSTEIINDELLKRLSQDFVYVDKRTGIRWIGTKARSQPMNTLLSRFSWKPKISHYEKYSDMIRTNPKRTVPVKSPDTIRTKLTQPWASVHNQ